MKNINVSRDKLLSDAATHLRVALDLLDQAAAPGQIGARVDHALCEIDDILPLDAAPRVRELSLASFGPLN